MILWFSGNGNSRFVAEQLAEKLGDECRFMLDCQTLDAKERRIVWVFPVYSWGIPPVVLSRLRNMKLPPEAEHYLVLTCGDDIGYTDRQWRRELLRRDAACKVRSAFSVIMPNTYVLLPGMDTDKPAVEEAKISAATERLRFVCKAIRTGARIEADVTRGSMPWLKSKVLYPLFVATLMSPKPFHSDDRCVGCGKCAATCPMKNIEMRDNRPVWGKNCAMCLGCYHVCPHHAVCYGHRTDGKHQYRRFF